MKVIIGLVVVAVLAGLATNWLRHRGQDLLHHAFDTSLPHTVEAHPWAPLHHGRPRAAERVTFSGGRVTTARCRLVLGSYTVRITHGFSFAAGSAVRAGCPDRQLQAALATATHVEVQAHGRAQRLVFTDADDHTVAQLQGRAPSK